MTPAAVVTAGGHANHGEEGGGGWLATSGAIILILVLVNALWPQPQPMGRGGIEMLDMPGVDRLELKVSGMRCNGCVESVTRALNECTGVDETSVDLAAGRADVRGSGFDRSSLAEAVRALGFEVEVVVAE
jgi:copper chaperone CopZ